jgi:hypothetical protein
MDHLFETRHFCDGRKNESLIALFFLKELNTRLIILRIILQNMSKDSMNDKTKNEDNLVCYQTDFSGKVFEANKTTGRFGIASSGR